MKTELLAIFKEAWLYTSTFRTFEGDNVEIKSVCLVKEGVDFINVFNGWCRSASHSYICTGKISIEEAFNLPSLPDRLSLQSRIEIIGYTGVQYLTHEYELRYL